MKDDAPRVIKIPAKPETTRQAEARRQLRVAAYCRVSTKEEDQANSYEVQKEYYTDKIMSNTAWTMAGTPASMHSQSGWSAVSAGPCIAVAHGHETVKNESCGAV